MLKNNPAFSERLGFIESWLEDHELFFEDMRHALQGIFKKLSGDAALPSYGWVGNELIAYLIQFDAGKFPKKRESKEILNIRNWLQKIMEAPCPVRKPTEITRNGPVKLK